ncbi:uncharacterized protein LOC110016927 [Oryzias latipes]
MKALDLFPLSTVVFGCVRKGGPAMGASGDITARAMKHLVRGAEPHFSAETASSVMRSRLLVSGYAAEADVMKRAVPPKSERRSLRDRVVLLPEQQQQQEKKETKTRLTCGSRLGFVPDSLEAKTCRKASGRAEPSHAVRGGRHAGVCPQNGGKFPHHSLLQEIKHNRWIRAVCG